MVFCATTAEIEGQGGLYFNNCKECKVSSAASDSQLAKLLWDKCTSMIDGVVN